jgi:hypothetical protein
MKLIYEQYVDTLKSMSTQILLKESRIPCLDLLCTSCPYLDSEEDCHSARRKDFDATVAYYQKAYPEDFL